MKHELIRVNHVAKESHHSGSIADKAKNMLTGIPSQRPPLAATKGAQIAQVPSRVSCNRWKQMPAAQEPPNLATRIPPGSDEDSNLYVVSRDIGLFSSTQGSWARFKNCMPLWCSRNASMYRALRNG
jgi:hypothetical protein